MLLTCLPRSPHSARHHRFQRRSSHLGQCPPPAVVAGTSYTNTTMHPFTPTGNIGSTSAPGALTLLLPV